MSFGKRIVVILLIVVMAVGIIHVGKNKIILDEETKKMSYYQTENVYLWYSDDRYTDFFTNAAVAFHEKNPDIRVIPTLISSAEYLETINEASLSNDNYPDIYMLTNDSLEKVYLAGLASKAKDVENVLNLNHFGQGALSAVTYHNSYVAYPLSFDTCVLLYNKTYLLDWVDRVNAGELTADEDETEDAEAELAEIVSLEDFIPSSFEDLIAFADKYEAADGVENVLEWDVSDVFFNYLFVGDYMIVGGDAGDDTNNINIFNDQVLACGSMYQNLHDVFSIDAETATYNQVLQNFLDGKTVFTMVTTDAIATINETVAQREEAIRLAKEADALDKIGETEDGNAPENETDAELSEEASEDEIKIFEYGYARIPEVSSAFDSRSLSVTNSLVINGYSEVKEAANRFAAFVSTEYSNELYARTGELAASKDAGLSDQASLIFQEEYAESIPLAKMVEAANLWVQLEIVFTDLWAGEDITTTIKNFSQQISSQMVTN